MTNNARSDTDFHLYLRALSGTVSAIDMLASNAFCSFLLVSVLQHKPVCVMYICRYISINICAIYL